MARQVLIAGNWKMNLLPIEAWELIEGLKVGFTDQPGLQVAVIPSPALVGAIGSALSDCSIALGAQTSSDQRSGAFTGDSSPVLLRALGCEYCLSGHSERRQYHGETDEQVAKQAKAQIEAGMTSIVCVGESLKERESGKHMEKIANQVNALYDMLDDEQYKDVVIAYEPIWAIGTGKTASPEQAQEVHAMIRGVIKERAGKFLAASTVIQYGGSAKPSNAAELLAQPDIDGFLVGGAALKAEDFLGIIQAYKPS